MFELLLGLIIGYGVWRILVPGKPGSALSSSVASTTANAGAAGGTEQRPRFRKVLHVEGTEPVDMASVSFVKNYGVSPAEVLDMRQYRVEQDGQDPPGRVLDCLQRSYGEGFARGVEAAQVAERARFLRCGETVYFVLVRNPSQPMEDLVAFVRPATP